MHIFHLVPPNHRKTVVGLLFIVAATIVLTAVVTVAILRTTGQDIPSAQAHVAIYTDLAAKAHPELQDCVWHSYRHKLGDLFIQKIEHINPNHLTDFERARWQWFFSDDVAEGDLFIDTGTSHPCWELWTERVTEENDGYRNHAWETSCQEGVEGTKSHLPSDTWEVMNKQALDVDASKSHKIRIAFDALEAQLLDIGHSVKEDCSRFNPQLMVGRWVVLGEAKSLR